MIDLGVVAAVFALIFVGELPDKTAVAALVLGTKFHPRWVWTGMAAAFVVHVVVAVAAGSLIALLPRRPVEFVVAALFLLGTVLLWRESTAEDDEDAGEDRSLPEDASFFKVAGLGFGVILVAEFGDLTQILTANLAAHYNDPVSVGIGAALALWLVAGLAILGGKTLLRVLPISLIVRIAAVVMIGLAGYSTYTAFHG